MTHAAEFEKYKAAHIGGRIEYSPSFPDIAKIADYIRTKCADYGVECSFDVTAQENPYFKTINYTTYAGMVVIHPLDFAQSMFQMYDAKADCLKAAGHIDAIADRVAQKTVSKYSLNHIGGDYDAVAVLCGHNKFKKHIDVRRLDGLVKRYGKRLAIKPHPITEKGLIDYLGIYCDFATVLDQYSDVYSVIDGARDVYTTHISETALTGLVMGKAVSPLDHFQNRFTGSFGHINHFCFTERDPIGVLGSIFASSKSGVICPQSDHDWRGKIDEYFAYTMQRRETYKGAYNV